jgi:hypothetical protein
VCHRAYIETVEYCFKVYWCNWAYIETAECYVTVCWCVIGHI